MKAFYTIYANLTYHYIIVFRAAFCVFSLSFSRISGYVRCDISSTYVYTFEVYLNQV